MLMMVVKMKVMMMKSDVCWWLTDDWLMTDWWLTDDWLMVVKVVIRWNDWFEAIWGFWFQTDEWTDEWKNGRMDEQTNGQTDEWTNRQMDKRTTVTLMQFGLSDPSSLPDRKMSLLLTFFWGNTKFMFVGSFKSSILLDNHRKWEQTLL